MLISNTFPKFQDVYYPGDMIFLSRVLSISSKDLSFKDREDQAVELFFNDMMEKHLSGYCKDVLVNSDRVIVIKL